MTNEIIFETARLVVRKARATETDAGLLAALWTDPRVMTYVGFPQGLPVTPARILDQLSTQADAVFDAYLIVERKETGEAIGECKLGTPDDEGIAETDIKLLPRFWGHHYGIEIKQGLLDYLFTHTACRIVQATPNIANTASIKMQEAVGGKRVGERTFEPPPERRIEMITVHAYVYWVYREDWMARRTP